MSAERIAVHVHADDPILHSGMVAQLRARPELRLVDAGEQAQATAVLVVADTLDAATVVRLRSLRRTLSGALVLVVSSVDDAALATAVECGVVGLVRRSEATAEHLVRVLRSAVRGEGALPADLLGRLMEQMGRLQRQVLEPNGISFAGLHTREVEVLRLLSEGHDTREIAKELAYSERTVKNVLYNVTARLQLRNRSHAVAYALRHGLI
ncbi:LuxR C-terminal-related transcriptional regulator [Kitasatospora sp. NPDC052896]|uniref:response regulator transcription factor n=1 Tax=Kitasatospora sp. NPDC052896 TaxID=3364061 RepID=UPI0037CB3DDE